jgi:6-pyruvoyl-tetrahydropterin synthase
LRAEVINTPFYHYTHGLKKHDGNCQRIAHGHRSKVVVFENQQESIKCQEYWAKRWCDIYIGSDEDIVDIKETVFSLLYPDPNHHHVFAYESSQGRFELAIPKTESEMIDTDTTVECLAQFMADEHKRLSHKSDFKVLAYEGVGKGAIAFA